MAGTSDSLRLAELTCARLCHDLSGLLGTLRASLDLVDDQTADGNEALVLARDASADLVRRLRLLRAAWGPDTGPLTPTALVALAAGRPGAHRVGIAFDGLAPDIALSPPLTRMVLNLIILGCEGLPRGGEVHLAGTVTDLSVRIVGPGAVWPAGLAACLDDEAAAVAALTSPRGLQTPFVALLARDLDLRLSLAQPTAVADDPPALRLQAA